MKLPTELFISGLNNGKIYFFENVPDKFGINRHYHICLKKANGNIIYFCCCTSQEEKINERILHDIFKACTIVHIKKDDINNFTKEDTYVNCNKVFEIGIEELIYHYESDNIILKGEVSSSKYLQIIDAILSSILVEDKIKDNIQIIKDNILQNTTS